MLKLHFLNVDNGDCIIIEFEDQNQRAFGVVDCNRTKRRTSAARDKLLQLGASDLSFVCLTHPDLDHYSGLLDVLQTYAGKVDLFLSFPIGDILGSKKRLKKLSRQYLLQAERARDAGDRELARGLSELVEILKHATEQFLPSSRWHELLGIYNPIPVAGFNGVSFKSIMPPARAKGPMIEAIERGEAVEKEIQNNEISCAIMIEYAGNKILLGGDATSSNWDCAHHEAGPTCRYGRRAGFAKGDPEFIDAFIENFKRIASWRRW